MPFFSIPKPRSDVWDAVWQNDRYSSRRTRQKRAARRWRSFGFPPALVSATVIADIGCGSGDSLAQLAPHVNAHVLLGIDSSSTALSLARIVAVDSRVTFVQASILDLPIADSSVDAVTIFGVLEHVSDPASALAEVNRILVPGGLAIITTSNAFCFLQLFDYVKALLGARYKYGYQGNWSPSAFSTMVATHLDISRMHILHADWDMPVSTTLDYIMSLVARSHWGRYICISARKAKANDIL